MLITEFRITMPMSVEEYQVGMLYSVAQASLEETGGGEGVEVMNNEPYDGIPLLGSDQFTRGQYTKKVYHLESKVPTIVKYVAPKGSLQLLEEAWNATKYCRTVITNPGYMKENFLIKLETYCAPDRGESENVHQLNAEQLALRKVVHIDIAAAPAEAAETAEEGETNDPCKYQFSNSDPPRGPLGGEWRTHVNPVMTVYKLVTVEFKWFGLQGNVESFIMGYEERLFYKFHRKIFCSMHNWFSMTIEDIRALEDQTKHDLEKQRASGEKRGTTVIQ